MPVARKDREYWLDLAQSVGLFLVKHGDPQQRKEWAKTLRKLEVKT